MMEQAVLYGRFLRDCDVTRGVERLNAWRSILGKVAAVCCLIFMLAALDGLVSGARTPESQIRLLPGETIKVNGALGAAVGSIADLTYASSSELINLTFETLHAGFWLGGNMWRGMITVSPHISPGQYSLRVTAAGEDPAKPSRIFAVEVYADHTSYRKSEKSLLGRYLDLSPWWVFGCFFVLTSVCFVLVFLFSHRRAAVLAERGIADVYHMERVEDGHRLSFGLGASHGVREGMGVTVLDSRGTALAVGRVEQCTEIDSTAHVSSEANLVMGCMIAVRFER